MQSHTQMSARRGTLAIMNALAAAAFSIQAIVGAREHHTRDAFYFALWFVWMLATLIWVFGTPGYLRWNAAERAALNDELVKAHQASAAKGALAVAMFGLTLLSTSTFFRLETPLWALPAVTSVTVVSAGLIFGWLERRDV